MRSEELALHADDLLEPVDDLYEVALCLHHGVDVLICSGSLVKNPVVSKNTNGLKIHVPGRFGLEVPRRGSPREAKILGRYGVLSQNSALLK